MEEILYKKFREVEAQHWWFQARREIVQAVAAAAISAPDTAQAATGTMQPKARILDVGCGTGFFLDAVKDTYETWGVDASPVAVNLCHERGLKNVFLGSATNLSAVADKQFDAVFFLDVIEHLDDDRAALLNAAALLRPNGVVIITVPAFMFMWTQHDDLNQHKRRYVRAQLETLLRDMHFDILKLSYFNAWLFPVAVAVRTGKKLLRFLTPGADAGDEFAMPPARINTLFRNIFASEKKTLLSQRGTFSAGLSLIAVARRK